MNDETKDLLLQIGDALTQSDNRSISLSHEEDRWFKRLLEENCVRYGNVTRGIDGVIYLDIDLTFKGEELYSVVKRPQDGEQE